MSENTQSNAAADQAPAPKAPKAPKTATASRPAAAGRERPEGAPAEDVHEVKKGETLEEIAEAHKTTAAELQRVNAIKKPELIWPGMQLRFR